MEDPYLAASEMTRLTRWWPRVRDAGVPVPQTTIYPLPPGAVLALFDGQDPGPALAPAALAQWIRDSGLPYPVFVRTDILSAKHRRSPRALCQPDLSQDCRARVGQTFSRRTQASRCSRHGPGSAAPCSST